MLTDCERARGPVSMATAPSRRCSSLGVPMGVLCMGGVAAPEGSATAAKRPAIGTPPPTHFVAASAEASAAAFLTATASLAVQRHHLVAVAAFIMVPIFEAVFVLTLFLVQVRAFMDVAALAIAGAATPTLSMARLRRAASTGAGRRRARITTTAPATGTMATLRPARSAGADGSGMTRPSASKPPLMQWPTCKRRRTCMLARSPSSRIAA